MILFGLCTAPTTFQNMMKLENWVTCVVYLNDVFICGGAVEENNDRLLLVLSRIREADFMLSPQNADFLEQTLPIWST